MYPRVLLTMEILSKTSGGEKNLSGIDWVWFLICLVTFSIMYN